MKWSRRQVRQYPCRRLLWVLLCSAPWTWPALVRVWFKFDIGSTLERSARHEAYDLDA